MSLLLSSVLTLPTILTLERSLLSHEILIYLSLTSIFASLTSASVSLLDMQDFSQLPSKTVTEVLMLEVSACETSSFDEQEFISFHAHNFR